MYNLYIKKFNKENRYYVGITKNFKRRMWEHKNDAYKNKSKLPVHCAMRKYFHETIIVYKRNNIKDILLLEIKTIKKLKNLGFTVYNVTGGGEGSLGMSGEKHPMYGKKHSKETLEKMSKSRIGKVISLEIREKLSKANRGFKHSEETKNKMSEIRNGMYVGSKNPMYGKSHSEETKQKISNSRNGKCIGEDHFLYGKQRSDDVKEKISKANTGKKRSDEFKAELSKRMSKTFRLYKEKYHNQGLVNIKVKTILMLDQYMNMKRFLF